MPYVSRFGPNPERAFYMLAEEMLFAPLGMVEFRLLCLLLHYEKKQEPPPSVRNLAAQWETTRHRLLAAMTRLVEIGYVLEYERHGKPHLYLAAFPAIPLDDPQREAFERAFERFVINHLTAEKATEELRGWVENRPTSGSKIDPLWVENRPTPAGDTLYTGNIDSQDVQGQQAAPALEEESEEPPSPVVPEAARHNVSPDRGPDFLGLTPLQEHVDFNGLQDPDLDLIPPPPPLPKPGPGPEPPRPARKPRKRVDAKLTAEELVEFKAVSHGLTERVDNVRWARENEAASAMVRRGYKAAAIMAAFDYYQAQPYYRTRVLSLQYVDEHIEAWSKHMSANSNHGENPHDKAAPGSAGTDITERNRAAIQRFLRAPAAPHPDRPAS